jgi:UDP-N-acetylglucosamine--N-acetylmuramyl-(pentapeptide) pyrophosphoryl-undecaprenol N-acetylglucosamine transferase
MRTLLVASEGGHLLELYLLSERMGLTKECVWVTFDTPQSRALLAGREVFFAPFAGTRDIIGTVRATLWARAFLRTNQFDRVVSTGASLALAVLPLASRSGSDCYYIESATRTEGPSLTGRLLTSFRSIHFSTQHRRWANQRWEYETSIFDGFRSFPGAHPSQPQSIVVSLGMHRGFSFRRLLERLVEIIPDGTEVLWQVGDTDASGLGIDFSQSLPAPKLAQAMADSDAVITHAGIGSAITALESGKRPIFVPRRKRFKEHVDDHQVSIASELDRQGLVFYVEADEIQWSDIVRAAAWSVQYDEFSRLLVD